MFLSNQRSKVYEDGYISFHRLLSKILFGVVECSYGCNLCSNKGKN